jgi:hypothetical protein
MKDMRYIGITLVLIFLTLSSSFGQVRSNKKQRAAWTFSMGPSIGLMDGTRFSPTTMGAMFEPRLIFGSMGRHSSASLGMPLMIYSFKQSYGVDSIVTNGFTVNMPFVFDFNFYHGAFKNTDNRIGVYFGAGWNFNYTSFGTSNREGVKENYEGLNHGVYTNGGIKFGFPSGVSFDVKVYASLTFKTPELTLYGVALLYNFGMRKKRGGTWY